jgi:hypothetical protein
VIMSSVLCAGQSGSPGSLDEGWCGLSWTPWTPLERQAVRHTTPTLPGIYRVRRDTEELQRLVYVGQTGRTLRERLLALAAGTNGEDCPFNDPHTAAPHLWLLRRLDGARFEFSCAPVQGDMRWPPALRQVAMRESCSYKRNRSSHEAVTAEA